MADSVLTSITLAGGSFNVYYDTVISVMSVKNYTSNNTPSGWKAAICISCYTYMGNNWGTLVSPVPIFNIGSQVTYNGTFIDSNSIYTVYGFIRISSTDFNINGSASSNSITSTIIFVA